MKLLIDNALSPKLAEYLVQGGIKATHLRELLSVKSSDEDIFQYASENGFIIVSTDTDFAVLLANRETKKPSLILFRHSASPLPTVQCEILVDLLPSHIRDLEDGCVISISGKSIRVRNLPFG